MQRLKRLCTRCSTGCTHQRLSQPGVPPRSQGRRPPAPGPHWAVSGAGHRAERGGGCRRHLMAEASRICIEVDGVVVHLRGRGKAGMHGCLHAGETPCKHVHRMLAPHGTPPHAHACTQPAPRVASMRRPHATTLCTSPMHAHMERCQHAPSPMRPLMVRCRHLPACTPPPFAPTLAATEM